MTSFGRNCHQDRTYNKSASMSVYVVGVDTTRDKQHW